MNQDPHMPPGVDTADYDRHAGGEPVYEPATAIGQAPDQCPKCGRHSFRGSDCYLCQMAPFYVGEAKAAVHRGLTIMRRRGATTTEINQFIEDCVAAVLQAAQEDAAAQGDKLTDDEPEAEIPVEQMPPLEAA